MLNNARDFAIIVWIVSQGWFWMHPELYGEFNAQADAAYNQEMEKLGLWVD